MTRWKFAQIEPQPARGVLRPYMWEDLNWTAEVKYDGDRRITQFCKSAIRFTGRRKSVTDGLYVEKTDNLPHLNAPVLSLEGTVLDGEMIYTGEVWDNGGRSKYVTSIMGSLPEAAVTKQETRGWLEYVVFDCLFFKGQDIRNKPWAERRLAAQEAERLWPNDFVKISSLSGFPARQKRGFYEAVVKAGGEGVILKHVDGRYGDASAWVKVKREATADVVIMGYKPAKAESRKVSGLISKTKYAEAGLVGAVLCGQIMAGKLTEVASVSGMDDVLRAELTAHGPKYLGRVIEIAHNGIEPTGRFRHPRFRRFRDDKEPEDCTGWAGES